jgi:hypothetical protein
VVISNGSSQSFLDLTFSIALFLPSILKDLGYTSSRAQIMSIPIHIVAAIVMVTIAFGINKNTDTVLSCWVARFALLATSPS